jgi:hypothetical protein
MENTYLNIPGAEYSRRRKVRQINELTNETWNLKKRVPANWKHFTEWLVNVEA